LGERRRSEVPEPPETECKANEEPERDPKRAADSRLGYVRYRLGGGQKSEQDWRLPRYEGPKPSYTVNPAHVPGQGLRSASGKTPLPSDAQAVYETAVPGSPTNPTTWWGMNSKGQIYRYSDSNDGTAHFSGIVGVGDGARNITPYAIDRLEAQQRAIR
jgi:hypothetical protein